MSQACKAWASVLTPAWRADGRPEPRDGVPSRAKGQGLAPSSEPCRHLPRSQCDQLLPSSCLISMARGGQEGWAPLQLGQEQ